MLSPEGRGVDSNDGEKKRAAIRGAADEGGISGEQESRIVGRDLGIRDDSESKGENKVSGNARELSSRCDGSLHRESRLL